MIYKIEIILKGVFRDRHGEHVRSDIADLGMKNVPKVKYSQLYRIDGDLTPDEAGQIASRLLIDPITDVYAVTAPGAGQAKPGKKDSKRARHEIEVWLKPGVTDTVAESVVKAVRDLGIDKPVKVKTGHKFVFEGAITVNAVRQIAERLLVNPMVQEYILQ